MNNRAILGILGVVVLIVLVYAGWVLLADENGNNGNGNENGVQVSNFQECVDAGYPVQESFPRRCLVPGGETFTEDIGNMIEKQDLIRLEDPSPNEAISSPLTVTGEARGTWYFEATFSVSILDANGNEVVESFVEAQDDWMTEEFVPFEGTIEFSPPTTATGTLVLHRANPSGLPENADSLRIPIRFSQQAPEEMTVQVHFIPSDFGSGTDCSVTQAVDRQIAQTNAVARAALQELFQGPTQAEQNQGLTTSIPSGVTIQSLRVENGIAYADFNEQLEEQVGGSCRVIAIVSQIEKTLEQFPTVDDVVISIDGRTGDILQP